MRALLPILLLVITACGGATYTQQRDIQVRPPTTAPPEQSLVPSDSATLSDGEIHRILTARTTLPAKIRIALVHLEHNSEGPSYWRTSASQDVRKAVGPRVVEHVRQSRLVADASYLPLFLFSSTPSIAQLREAAARYQADLILIFSTDCSRFHEVNLFTPDEARAYCRADSAVLDVRTGLVPFVSRSEHVATLDESSREFSVLETTLRAEVESIDRAMLDNATALAKFLADAQAASREPAGKTEAIK